MVLRSIGYRYKNFQNLYIWIDLSFYAQYAQGEISSRINYSGLALGWAMITLVRFCDNLGLFLKITKRLISIT